jgi:hypothetical protein
MALVEGEASETIYRPVSRRGGLEWFWAGKMSYEVTLARDTLATMRKISFFSHDFHRTGRHSSHVN